MNFDLNFYAFLYFFMPFYGIFLKMNKNKKALQTLIYQGFSRLFAWQGLQGLEVALQPLLRCPKSAGAPVGAADFDRCANPCSLCPPPAAVASVARHAPRADRLSLFTQSKKKKHRLNRCFFFLAGAEGLDRMLRLRLASFPLGDRNSHEFQYPPHAFG